MKISVVIPAYNSEATVTRAIDSVLDQTRPADEIIVVDDGSTDKTAGIVRSYGDKVILIQQENAGVSVARNKGIEAATGDWIAFLDADDEWLPEKLKLQSEHLSRYPDFKWTYSNFYRIDPYNKERQLAHNQKCLNQFLIEESFEDYFLGYKNHGYAWTSVLLINRDVFSEVGLFMPGMKRAQDNDMWYRIAYEYPRVGYLSEPLAVYHLDTPGSSTKINDQIDFMKQLVARHLELSQKYNRYDAFRPCIAYMIQIWIRQLITQNRYTDTRLLLDQFHQYLSARFQREIRFRLLCPPITSWIAEGYTKFKRTFKG